MPNDRLQYEFSDSLGGNYFDLRFNQGDELGEWLRVYIWQCWGAVRLDEGAGPRCTHQA